MRHTYSTLREKCSSQIDLVSAMVLLYPELESVLLNYVTLALDVSADDGVRLLYRTRSEADRLNIADAILHPFFSKMRLEGAYSQFLGAIRHCKTIRNQYAHAVWDVTEENTLRFASLDEPARTKEGETFVPFRPIDLSLLESQYAFFEYTNHMGWYVIAEAEFRMDRRKRHKVALPKPLPRPKLHSLQR